LYFGGREALDQSFREGPIAEANIDPSLACGRSQPIEEHLPHAPTPDAHPALVGFSVIELNGLPCHERRAPRFN
jgi:hypothetical protein